MPLYSRPISRRILIGALPGVVGGLAASANASPAEATSLQALAASGAGLQGTYPGHLQGVCTNDRDALYWSMTTDLVKTDLSGAVTHSIAVPSHHGDLCHLDGRIYVAVNLGLFNDPEGRSDSWIHVHDARDLSLIARHPIAQVVYGAGGIAVADGRFIVVGGLPPGAGENLIYQYDLDFASGRRIALPTGQTRKGVQTAAFDGDHWWFGCYGDPEFMEVLIRTDRNFSDIRRFRFDASTGLVPLGDGAFLVARSACGAERCVARLAPARLDDWIASGRLAAA